MTLVERERNFKYCHIGHTHKIKLNRHSWFTNGVILEGKIGKCYSNTDNWGVI